jgi:hypothetical protein
MMVCNTCVSTELLFQLKNRRSFSSTESLGKPSVMKMVTPWYTDLPLLCLWSYTMLRALVYEAHISEEWQCSEYVLKTQMACSVWVMRYIQCRGSDCSQYHVDVWFYAKLSFQSLSYAMYSSSNCRSIWCGSTEFLEDVCGGTASCLICRRHQFPGNHCDAIKPQSFRVTQDHFY